MYIVEWWKKAQEFAHRHHHECKRAHNATHLAYFCMVASHGPYHIAALCLLVMGVVFWVLRLEE